MRRDKTAVRKSKQGAHAALAYAIVQFVGCETAGCEPTQSNERASVMWEEAAACDP